MSTNQVTPEQQWLSALTGAKISAKTENPLKDLNVDEIREGLTFKIEIVPRGAVDHMKKLVGANNLTSLDKKGRVMKEMDTVGHRGKHKGIDEESQKKATEALKKIGAIKDKALKEKFAAAGYEGQ